MPAPNPPYSDSDFITSVTWDRFRYHRGDGDMWPLTWAADDNLYGGAGDNQGSPMNFWRIEGDGLQAASVYLVDNLPVDPKRYCRIPPADPTAGIKPAGLLSMHGRLCFAVEAMNYGENPSFNRQRNIHGWIITSDDFGRTWNREATPTNFFEDRLSSCHFVQYGKDNADALDEYVYAYFPGVGDDGHSYWENGDGILLGRVHRDRILQREAWTFFAGLDGNNAARWTTDDRRAELIFHYTGMTGEDHVSYNPGLRRYLLVRATAIISCAIVCAKASHSGSANRVPVSRSAG